MTELEIAVNQRVGEWEVIQESGTTLRPMWGEGLTGMKNLGNSCYLNSVMQVLFTIPDFQTKLVSFRVLVRMCGILVFLPCLSLSLTFKRLGSVRIKKNIEILLFSNDTLKVTVNPLGSKVSFGVLEMF